MLLHAQIESNKRKTWLIAGGFLVFFALVGASVGLLWFDNPVGGIVLAVIFGGIYIAIMMATGTKVVMAMNSAREIRSEDENPFLWNTVESLTIAARLPMPKIYIIEDPSPNAFAAGMSPKNAAVAVTRGLLDRLNRQEIEAVLAHEVAHIKNFDVRIATTAIALVAVISVLSDMVMRSMWYSSLGRSRNRRNSRQDNHPVMMIIALLVLVIAPLVAVLIQLALSRNREYLADASGAELCRNPMALASALRKISGIDEPVRRMAPSCAALYFADPTKKKRSRTNLFSTHPPVEERIRRLEQMM